MRVALALVLFAAAGLKGHQLATEPFLGVGVLSAPWFLLAVVEFELLLGFCLLLALWPRLTWHVAAVSFASFAGVSLFKALSGELSCGCFGRIPVHPWWTFALDLTVVAALFCCEPVQTKACPARPAVGQMRRAALVGLVWLMAGVSLGVAITVSNAAVSTDLGEILDDGREVVLKPERWPGKRFPLLKYIDGEIPLDAGKWIVVLYRFDCPLCRETLPKYEKLAAKLAVEAAAARVALIELPPRAGTQASKSSPRSPCLVGRLQNATEWFAVTPIEITLENGTVREVKAPSELVL